MAELHTLLTRRGLLESPRWHNDRLWFSDWVAREVVAVPLLIAAPGWEAANRVEIKRARATGLTFRPHDETIRETERGERGVKGRRRLSVPNGSGSCSHW